MQLFELGPDGGDHETDGDLLAETDVLAYDCAARYCLCITVNHLNEIMFPFCSHSYSCRKKAYIMI